MLLTLSHFLFEYQSPINQLITQLKFHNQLHLAYWFGRWFCQRYRGELPQAILPVPLHVQRLRERGFNQALEIAKPIARYFKLPLIKTAVVRHKLTTPQTTLSKSQRQTNLHQAFRLKHPLSFHHIAILDDVITTGATIQSLIHCLKQSSIERIDVWAIARRD